MPTALLLHALSHSHPLAYCCTCFLLLKKPTWCSWTPLSEGCTGMQLVRYLLCYISQGGARSGDILGAFLRRSRKEAIGPTQLLRQRRGPTTALGTTRPLWTASRLVIPFCFALLGKQTHCHTGAATQGITQRQQPALCAPTVRRLKATTNHSCFHHMLRMLRTAFGVSFWCWRGKNGETPGFDGHALTHCFVLLGISQGLYKSRLDCPQCGFTSVKFDPFMCVNQWAPASLIRLSVSSKLIPLRR
jgi:hypothetical protein